MNLRIKQFVMKGVMFMSIMGFISGCGGPSLKKYETSKPELSLEEYFDGNIKAWGFVQDRKGDVVRRFDVDMVGKWEDNVGTLEESFRYYDGETQGRVWTIKKLADDRYEGSASDIIGTAKGNVKGSAVRWAYQMDLPVGDDVYRVVFDDWMFLMNDDVLINRSYIKKFGFTVAELTLFMQKQKD
jgi:hypothetical protein